MNENPTMKTHKLFSNAFKIYEDKLCHPLSLTHRSHIKINDNIFVHWMYIYCMSIAVREYMEQNDTILIPLQIDLVIIPNCVVDVFKNEIIDCHVGSISERLTTNKIIFNEDNNKILCSPAEFQSLLHLINKAINQIKTATETHRIIFVIDRRNIGKDHLYYFTAPAKYGNINNKYEIINCIYNTSNYLLPRSKYNPCVGAKDESNLLVMSYIIRSKTHFPNLFPNQQKLLTVNESQINKTYHDIILPLDYLQSLTPERIQLKLKNHVFPLLLRDEVTNNRNIRDVQDVRNTRKINYDREKHKDAFKRFKNENTNKINIYTYKDSIINYFEEHQINGMTLYTLPPTAFANIIKKVCGTEELTEISIKIYKMLLSEDNQTSTILNNDEAINKHLNNDQKLTKEELTKDKHSIVAEIKDKDSIDKDSIDKDIEETKMKEQSEKKQTKQQTKKNLENNIREQTEEQILINANHDNDKFNNNGNDIELEFNISENYVVNNYLYFNGFIRFLPTDIIHILPQFFNTPHQSHVLLEKFQVYHETLWHLFDDILPKWNIKYLKDNDFQKSKIKREIHFDNQLTKEIAIRCKLEQKLKHKKPGKNKHMIFKLTKPIEDDIEQKYPWINQIDYYSYDLKDDIIITNNDIDEYY
eukprot:442712_1